MSSVRIVDSCEYLNFHLVFQFVPILNKIRFIFVEIQINAEFVTQLEIESFLN